MFQHPVIRKFTMISTNCIQSFFFLKFDERNNKILFSPSFFSSFDENRLLMILSRIIKLF